MNNNIQEQTKWSENVILVDADYVDKVAFNLIVNFERMLGRRIPQADMAHWLDCVALDGGIRQGDHEIFVALIHDKGKAAMENFKPGLYADLNEKAFKDQLGEFTIADSDDFFSEALQLIVAQKDVKRVMVIPNAEESSIYNKVREVLHRVDDDNKRITVFTMEPKPGGNFRQEILGYSLLAALGISSDEINSKS